MVKVGNKVRIKSRFAGIYDKRTGVVIDTQRPDRFILVKLHDPAIIGSTVIEKEIFFPDELTVIG